MGRLINNTNLLDDFVESLLKNYPEVQSENILFCQSFFPPWNVPIRIPWTPQPLRHLCISLVSEEGIPLEMGETFVNMEEDFIYIQLQFEIPYDAHILHIALII